MQMQNYEKNVLCPNIIGVFLVLNDLPNERQFLYLSLRSTSAVPSLFLRSSYSYSSVQEGRISFVIAMV